MAIDIAGQQVLAQPVSAFLQGRAIHQAEQESGARMKALEAAEGREQETFDMQKQDRQAKYDEINGKKALAGAQQVLALPKGQRKDFVAKTFPELVGQLEKQGYGKWDEIDEDELEEMATGIAARASADLGLGPEKPAEFNLGKGEKRFKGGKVIAENTTPDDDDWTNPEPVMIGGKKVMAQVNKRTGEPRVVPGATPIDKEGAGEKDKSFEHANVLRDEYNTQSKDYGTVKTSYETIKALGNKPSAAGDIALLTAYMRMVDPGSSVKEGEFANAENAGGVPTKVRARYNNILNGERLTEEQRKDFVSQSGTMLSAWKASNKGVRNRYKDLATRAKIDPLDVIGADEQETGEAPADAPPVIATGPNGQKLMLKGGQWVPFNG